jgi:hypothetical protein
MTVQENGQMVAEKAARAVIVSNGGSFVLCSLVPVTGSGGESPHAPDATDGS